MYSTAATPFSLLQQKQDGLCYAWLNLECNYELSLFELPTINGRGQLQRAVEGWGMGATARKTRTVASPEVLALA